MIHFIILRDDMPGEIGRIANFIETPIDESRWERIFRYYSFDYMKAHATKSVPLRGFPFHKPGPFIVILTASALSKLTSI